MLDLFHGQSLHRDGNSPALDLAERHALRAQALPDIILEWMDRYRWWLLGAVAGLYLAGFNGQWRIEPDGALYLSIARNLATGQGYTYQGMPHHLAYPGLPYLLAGTMKLFGAEHLWPAHAMMLAMGLGTLGLIYRLIYLHAGRPLAVLVTCGVGTSKLFYAYAFYLMTDMPFAMGVVALLAGYEAICLSAASRRMRWWDWGLLIGGAALAAITRPVIWVLAATLVGAAGWSMVRGKLGWRRGMASLLVIGATGTFLVWYRRQTGEIGWGEYERLVMVQVGNFSGWMELVATNVPRLLNPVLPMSIFGFEWGPIGNQIIAIILITIGVRLVRERLVWGIWVGATIAMMGLIVPVDRYLIPILPLLVYAWWKGLVWINRRVGGARGDWVFVGLLAAGSMINIARVGGVILEQHRRPFLSHYKEGRYADAQRMGKLIHEKVEDGAIVIAPLKMGRVLTYFSDKCVIESEEGDGKYLIGREGEKMEVVGRAGKMVLYVKRQ